MEDCCCSTMQVSIGEKSLEKFSAIRSCCPALHHLLVPDELWPDFMRWHRHPDTDAHHRSIVLLAMERGHLERVTSAIHRYLITGGLPSPEVTKQYRKDLRERWMLYTDSSERHKKFRIFWGHLVELQFAEWLESEGWAISGLEALREGPDIEARARDGRATAFEIKFIGTQNNDFSLVLESFAGRSAAEPVSPYAAVNYLLLRVYETAKQLQRMEDIDCDRIAAIVVEEQTWYRFELQLNNSWIGWANPHFFTYDENWEKLLGYPRNRYPNFPDDLQSTLRTLDAIWILRQSYGFKYDREVEIPFRT